MTSTSPSPPTASNTPFRFPRDYNFPPFFSRQPNATSFHAQADKWGRLVLDWCRHRRMWKLSLGDAVDSELFWNKKLERRLSLADAREMIDNLVKAGRAEWVGGAGAGSSKGDGKDVAWIWWRTPEEWAEVIASWVDETGQKNTVLTLYELTESESTLSQEFHGMDPDVLQKALSVLVKRGKAQVFGQEDQQGVKFF